MLVMTWSVKLQCETRKFILFQKKKAKKDPLLAKKAKNDPNAPALTRIPLPEL